MSDLAMAVLLTDALGGRQIDAEPGPAGRLVACGRWWDIESALTRIAQIKGWTVEKIDSARLNVNDLDYDSPITTTVRHASSSDRTWLFIVTGANAALLADERSMRGYARIAAAGPVVIVSDDVPTSAPEGWTLADVTGWV